MQTTFRQLSAVAASVLFWALPALALAPQADAASTESVVQFRITATSTRLSHDLKIAWAGAVNGTQCTSITVAPTTDRFPSDGPATVRVASTQLAELWLKAGDTVKADDANCVLLVTGLYTDANFTRPAVP